MSSSTAWLSLPCLYMLQWPCFLLACKDRLSWAWSSQSGLHLCLLASAGGMGRIRGLCLTAGLSCSEGQPSWGSSPSRQLRLTNRPAREHALDGKLQISQTPLHQGHNREDVEGHPLMRMMITSSVGEKTPPNCTWPELQQNIFTKTDTVDNVVQNTAHSSGYAVKALVLKEHLVFKSQHSHAIHYKSL